METIFPPSFGSIMFNTQINIRFPSTDKACKRSLHLNQYNSQPVFVVSFKGTTAQCRCWLDAHLGVEHDLRRPVPAGGYVLREESGVIVVGIGHTGQTKVTDLGLR